MRVKIHVGALVTQLLVSGLPVMTVASTASSSDRLCVWSVSITVLLKKMMHVQ